MDKVYGLLVIVLVCIIFAGCKKDPQQSAYTDSGFRVEKLFTHEGCTVYRFFDDRTVYYTTCKGSTHYSCGKACEDTNSTDVVPADEPPI